MTNISFAEILWNQNTSIGDKIGRTQDNRRPGRENVTALFSTICVYQLIVFEGLSQANVRKRKMINDSGKKPRNAHSSLSLNFPSTSSCTQSPQIPDHRCATLQSISEDIQSLKELFLDKFESMSYAVKNSRATKIAEMGPWPYYSKGVSILQSNMISWNLKLY